MKIKLDENLPTDLAGLLHAQGHDVHSVHDEGLAGALDERVRAAAARENRFLLTQDVGLGDVRNTSNESGVLVLRLREPHRRALIDRVMSIFTTEEVSTWMGCIVIATESRVRVRRPSGTAEKR